MRGQKRRIAVQSDNEKFETEAFAYLNEEEDGVKKSRRSENSSDSEAEFSGLYILHCCHCLHRTFG